ncbi:formyltransferase family protein [Thermopetrobacter sp. TC1]|uniref:formyltransferase family protein n=1 Tax=Thermopetrobacter sp. TC1 TaxID=1495045 RepID=UPI0009DF3656|nr:formyltransferase family protein [Thermopetrobacter sp. TC1]
MLKAPNWWKKPRKVTIIVDNPSWILPYAKELVRLACEGGDNASLVQAYEHVPRGDIAFYIGCLKITPKEVLQRNKRNLVVHESDLPSGKGFSPLTWQILEGKNNIPICLIEAVDKVDSGDIIYRDVMHFEGHELINEIRHIQGQKTIELCMRFLQADLPPKGVPQAGQESFYPKRRPKDSEIDINKSIKEQFNLFRVVDNERYPAFFFMNGKKYILKIYKEEI